MSEDEVKPQSDEPTPEPVEDGVKAKSEEVEDKNDVEEEDEDEKMESEASGDDTKEHAASDAEEEEEKEKPKVVKAKKKKEVQETKTPEKDKEEGVPLYDQPLELSGKRDRKKVERFIQEEKKEELTHDGHGTPLGEIPYVDAMITNVHADELKVLHRVAYNRPGSGAEIKKNLRKFNGFPFTKEDKKYENMLGKVERVVKAEIIKMLNIVGLERSGSKGDVSERLVDFMMNPVDHGKTVPQKIKRKSTGKTKGRPPKSANKSTNAVESESADNNESSDAEEEEEETPKPKKAPAKKTPAKKTPAKRPASAKKATKTTKAASSDDSDSSSDDEPLAKKVKQPPTDVELKAAVKRILDGANLEEVTMKSVCRQVFDAYPDFDLGHKKDFIKEAVKSIIS